MRVVGRVSLVGFLDADGTYPPEYFPQLCQAALDDAAARANEILAQNKATYGDAPLLP